MAVAGRLVKRWVDGCDQGGRKTAKIGIRMDFLVFLSTYFRPQNFKSDFKSILTPHLHRVPSIATTITSTIATAKLAIFLYNDYSNPK